MNPLAWILNSLKVWPEPPSLPEDLDEVTVLELAEASSRLKQINQVTSELRRLVDRQLADKLDGKSLRYGEDIIRPTFRGRAKLIGDPAKFWDAIYRAVGRSDEPIGLLNELFPASSVRLTVLPKVADLLEVDPAAFKETFIDYDPPGTPLSVMPRSKAPKFLQDMEEGEIR